MVGSRFLYNNVSLGGGAIAISGPNPLLEIIDSLFYGNGIYTGTLYPPSLFLPPPSSPLFPITSSLQRCALCSKPLKMIISCVLFSFPFILKGWQLVHSLNIFFFLLYYQSIFHIGIKPIEGREITLVLQSSLCAKEFAFVFTLTAFSQFCLVQRFISFYRWNSYRWGRSNLYRCTPFG